LIPLLFHVKPYNLVYRNMIAVDPAKDTTQVLKADDKKMLEEEERETQDLPQVIMMKQTEQAKSPKKKKDMSQMYVCSQSYMFLFHID